MPALKIKSFSPFIHPTILLSIIYVQGNWLHATGFPGCAAVKNPPAKAGHKRRGLNPWVWKISRRGAQ